LRAIGANHDVTIFQAARPLLIWSIEANWRARLNGSLYVVRCRRDQADTFGRHGDRRQQGHGFQPDTPGTRGVVG